MTTFTTATQEAERRAKIAGVPVDMVTPYVETEIRTRPVMLEYVLGIHNDDILWDVTITHSDTDNRVSQFRLDLNIGHPWIRNQVLGDDTPKEVRSMIEVWLLTLAGTDKRKPEERKMLDHEAQVWGRRLRHATDILETIFYPDGRPETADA